MIKSDLTLALVAVLIPLGVASPLHAQHFNADDAPCKTAGTGVDMYGCLNLAAKKADENLNSAYRQILNVLQTQDRQNLQMAERLWLLYRNQTCSAERDLYGGGTGGLAAYPACLEAVTRHRTADLKSAYWWIVNKFGAK